MHLFYEFQSSQQILQYFQIVNFQSGLKMEAIFLYTLINFFFLVTLQQVLNVLKVRWKLEMDHQTEEYLENFAGHLDLIPYFLLVMLFGFDILLEL